MIIFCRPRREIHRETFQTVLDKFKPKEPSTADPPKADASKTDEGKK
jgi:hypothetical protein